MDISRPTPNLQLMPIIKKFLCCIPLKSYRYNCCCCFSVGKGLELFSCFDIFQSFQTLLYLIVFYTIDQDQNDPRVIFRIVEVAYMIPAFMNIYGIENDELVLVICYYYMKIAQIVLVIAKYITIFSSGVCSQNMLINSIKGYCYYDLDIAFFIGNLVMILYELLLLYSYANLVALGERAKATRDLHPHQNQPLSMSEAADHSENEMKDYKNPVTQNDPSPK